MNKDEKRLLQRKRLMDNKVYQTMNDITRYMDRYYLSLVTWIATILTPSLESFLDGAI